MDNMGGSAAGRLTGTTMAPNGNTLGATGGTQTNTAATSINSSGSNAINYGAIALAGGTAGSTYSLTAQLANGPDWTAVINGATTSVSGNTTVDGTFGINVSGSGTSSAFGIVQPTILLNHIIKT
jgi:hypothetical protein